ncbi:cupin domain-containing protein [Kribbella sp. CA-253562]|uniref:AraC family transcriptional regulator n=1 Tax=Kribbella sp. CA-253562 TaxID=3239942 RepID=UPI003D927F4E
MDVLSAVLRELRFESAGYRLLRLDAPFGVVFDKPGVRGMHVLVRGQCELVFDDGTIQELTAGDLVVFPRGDFHTLRSPGVDASHAVPGFDFAAHTPGPKLGTDDSGIDTVVVCGGFVTAEPDHPALLGMPRAVHVSGDLDRPRPWLAPLIDALALEATDGGPGSELAMARLFEVLLIRALRDHNTRIDQPGWLAGLRDPFVASALAALHEDPARPWTLAGLARTVGLSRASFALRFTSHVGEPAMRYLLGLRIQRAKALLRETHDTVATIATQVGYQSDVAFAAAFKREVGAAPAAYRRMAIKLRTSAEEAGMVATEQ